MNFVREQLNISAKLSTAKSPTAFPSKGLNFVRKQLIIIGSFPFVPPEARAIFLHKDFPYTDTCSVTG